MTRRKPELYRPPGKVAGGKYEPEPTAPTYKDEDAKPQLVDDRVSCRKQIDTVGGAKKYCPYKREPGSEFCKKHQH